jgi:predicted dehydrogenase
LVKIGVIGAGYLGKFHIQKLQEIENCKLIGIADIDSSLLKSYGHLGIKLTNDYKELLSVVDAVSIVVPTTYHFEVAKFFIKNGVHTFIEKPVTANVEECEELINITQDRINVQVGHIERFNPAYRVIKERVKTPKVMNFIRKGPFTARGTDVDVIYDLMIHDIDMAISLSNNFNGLTNLNVKGFKIKTNHNDYVNANFFIGDIFTHIETSRVSNSKIRRFTIVEDDKIYECDLINFTVSIISNNEELLISENKPVDVLKEELKTFVNSIIYNKKPPVTLIDGLNALKCAEMILNAVER